MTLLKPCGGRRVSDPARGDYLPENGREVDLNGDHLQHWARRLADGDVEIVEEKTALKPTARLRKTNTSANASED